MSNTKVNEIIKQDVFVESSKLTWLDWMEILSNLQDLVHLGLLSAGQVTQLIAEIHGEIGNSLSKVLLVKTGIIKTNTHKKAPPFIYALITGGFLGFAKILNQLHLKEIIATYQGLSQQESAQKNTTQTSHLEKNINWRRFRAALNGVAGDKLQEWDNRLAIKMKFCDKRGYKIAPENINQINKNLIIFIHGLCNSESDWQNPNHFKAVNELEHQGYQVIWLRYNSGLPIYQNGQQLDELLNTLDFTNKSLILIGHSMGGLLMRSAYEQTGSESQWLKALVKAIYIGTPHHGSPMERAGEFANRLLSISPFIKPLMRLGNIRSKGIKDLRHGYIDKQSSEIGIDEKSDQRETIIDLPENCQHLLIATSLQKLNQNILLGDGLVPVKSALGEHELHDFIIHADKIKRLTFEQIDHLSQLKDQQIHQAVLGLYYLDVA